MVRTCGNGTPYILYYTCVARQLVYSKWKQLARFDSLFKSTACSNMKALLSVKLTNFHTFWDNLDKPKFKKLFRASFLSSVYKAKRVVYTYKTAVSASTKVAALPAIVGTLPTKHGERCGLILSGNRNINLKLLWRQPAQIFIRSYVFWSLALSLPVCTFKLYSIPRYSYRDIKYNLAYRLILCTETALK